MYVHIICTCGAKSNVGLHVVVVHTLAHIIHRLETRSTAVCSTASAHRFICMYTQICIPGLIRTVHALSHVQSSIHLPTLHVGYLYKWTFDYSSGEQRWSTTSALPSVPTIESTETLLDLFLEIRTRLECHHRRRLKLGDCTCNGLLVLRHFQELPCVTN